MALLVSSTCPDYRTVLPFRLAILSAGSVR
jgi:hypothetical protein